jgi:hypothetical protein
MQALPAQPYMPNMILIHSVVLMVSFLLFLSVFLLVLPLALTYCYDSIPAVYSVFMCCVCLMYGDSRINRYSGILQGGPAGGEAPSVALGVQDDKDIVF